MSLIIKDGNKYLIDLKNCMLNEYIKITYLTMESMNYEFGKILGI